MSNSNREAPEMSSSLFLRSKSKTRTFLNEILETERNVAYSGSSSFALLLEFWNECGSLVGSMFFWIALTNTGLIMTVSACVVLSLLL